MKPINRNLIFVILFLCSGLTLQAQVFNYYGEFDFSKYYPLQAANMNDSVINTSNLDSMLVNVDTNSSIIYRKLQANSSARIYCKNGDTIKSLRYSFRTHEFTSIELFVYDAQNRIHLYIDCTDYYFNKSKIPVNTEVFYYEDNKLIDKLVYYTSKYEQSIGLASTFDLDKYKLTSSMHYTYQKTKTGLNIYSKECIGDTQFRDYDTTVLDRLGYIKQFNSFAQRRALGCPMGNNVNDIFTYDYSTDSVTITATRKTCMASDQGGNCFGASQYKLASRTRQFSKERYNYYECEAIRNKAINLSKNQYLIL
ncbi:MAG: hypothetical protein RL660_1640 [Bacteroidota bacterium]|jgi:hypothetical protein